MRELWCLSQLNQERNAIMNGSTRITRDDVLDLCEAIHATNPDLPVFGARGLGAPPPDHLRTGARHPCPQQLAQPRTTNKVTGGSWLRESRVRGDLDSGASEHLADRPGPELLLLGLDVLADQRDGRSHSAAIDKPTVLFRIALALRSSRTPNAGSLIRCAWSVVVPGLRPPSTWAFLTQERKASR